MSQKQVSCNGVYSFTQTRKDVGIATALMNKICIPSLYLHMLLILACFSISNAVQSDIDCLRSIKESLQDPENLLSSWVFSTNNTEGFICRYAGVECWHIDESRVLYIRLSDMGLRGPFPMGLKNCTSLTGLDLSSNNLEGPLPVTISDVLPFLTTLDLSSNNFSGQIPPSIGNCSNINILKLENNFLTGEIPPQLGRLSRIKEFSVSNNRLSGPIPYFSNYIIPPESLSNNLGLCGGPLRPCKNIKSHAAHEDPFKLGFKVGFPLSAIITTLLFFCFSSRGVFISFMKSYLIMTKTIIQGRTHRLSEETPLVQFTEESGSEESKVTAMEKHICRICLEDIEIATNNFDIKKVIGSGKMGLMYKAMFPNGLQLAVKRLHEFENFEKEFLLEIEILGRLRHTNLVPLLGFCFEMEKKFLVYKYMSNETLHQWLHCLPHVEGKKMGWTLRFKIALGIARGLAWLHHNNVLRVAHCQISSKCILLDDKFEPKISNFGNSNILMNTSGIPSSCCNFLVPVDSCSSPYKEDVYSFGILLLELVSGREPSTIKDHTGHLYDGDLSVIDECLMVQGFNEEIYETLKIAEMCIQARSDVKTSMLQVYQAMCAIGISTKEIYSDPYFDSISLNPYLNP